VKHVHTEPLIETGAFAESEEYATIKAELHAAIEAVVWPTGSDKFTIHPQSGRRSGEGNGVVPIKIAFIEVLRTRFDWEPEARVSIGTRSGVGKIDAVKRLPGDRIYAVEWETGNISSSHRSLNKLALGLIEGKLVGGSIVLPTRTMYRYLTDRIGNFEELAPYFPLWEHVCPNEGVLTVLAVEQDAADLSVPRITKGTDGRALI
jgi:hypothetical protein